MREITNQDFFFCYSIPLFHYLHFVKKFHYVACGWHEKQKNLKFWMFYKTPELSKAILEYKRMREKEVNAS